jgi:hypothetical protein
MDEDSGTEGKGPETVIILIHFLNSDVVYVLTLSSITHNNYITMETPMIKNFFPALLLTLLATLASCAAGPAASPVDGTWNFAMNSPMGSVSATVIMAANGDSLTGTFDLGDGRTWAMEDGVANGNEISFKIDRDGSPMVYEMTATVDGDSVAGVASAMGMEVPWTMTRGS